MIEHDGQYEYCILEDGKRIAGQVIDDPFVVSHIEFHLSRWDAFKAIFKPLVKVYTHRVWGTPASYRVVFQGDYYPPEPVEPSDAVGYYVPLTPSAPTT